MIGPAEGNIQPIEQVDPNKLPKKPAKEQLPQTAPPELINTSVATHLQQSQVEQTSVQGQMADGQGVAQNTAVPVVNGQPVYSDIALADYMAKQAARLHRLAF